MFPTHPLRVSLIIRSGVDFDDDEIDFHEEGKSHVKVTVMQFRYSYCLISSTSVKTNAFSINSLPVSPTLSWARSRSPWKKLESQR